MVAIGDKGIPKQNSYADKTQEITVWYHPEQEQPRIDVKVVTHMADGAVADVTMVRGMPIDLDLITVQTHQAICGKPSRRPLAGTFGLVMRDYARVTVPEAPLRARLERALAPYLPQAETPEVMIQEATIEAPLEEIIPEVQPVDTPDDAALYAAPPAPLEERIDAAPPAGEPLNPHKTPSIYAVLEGIMAQKELELNETLSVLCGMEITNNPETVKVLDDFVETYGLTAIEEYISINGDGTWVNPDGMFVKKFMDFLLKYRGPLADLSFQLQDLKTQLESLQAGRETRAHMVRPVKKEQQIPEKKEPDVPKQD